MFSNLKQWVKEKFPNGISEENWTVILDSDEEVS